VGAKDLKSLAQTRLQLDGLTVLIGENGAGKSAILEALELLRVCADPGDVANHLRGYHGGVPTLARSGAGSFWLFAEIEAAPASLLYGVRFDATSGGVGAERLEQRAGEAAPIIDRHTPELPTGVREWGTVLGTEGRTSQDEQLRLTRDLLAGIDVHVPFDVSAGWATRRYQRTSTVRGQAVLQIAHRLELFGSNLVNAYHTLKNEFGAVHWRDTMELIQLGLGHEVSDIAVSASAGGGHVGLAVDFASLGRVPAFALADGVLTYLAFVALVRLDEGRTLLAFDEPETHLHPALLARVVGLLEDAATRYPVVIATHSDRLLDCLSDPVAAVVVCELDDQHCTTLRRLDATQFETWRDDYRGVGDIRAEGQLSSILKPAKTS
jgi:predicted ATPase